MIKVKEIFTSIQGEGPYIGYKQLFIRFCDCNLNCKYCDTDFNRVNSFEYSKEQLIKICNDNLDCHSISLTGGEPLLQVVFLKEFLPECQLPVYLETNGTLCDNLEQIIDFVDYVSADIKLPSCSGLKSMWNEHDRFFGIAGEKMTFAKAVFDFNISETEIENMCKLCAKYNIELILQPLMINNKTAITSDFMLEVINKCNKIHKKTRLIPQVHKFINVI